MTIAEHILTGWSIGLFCLHGVTWWRHQRLRRRVRELDEPVLRFVSVGQNLAGRATRMETRLGEIERDQELLSSAYRHNRENNEGIKALGDRLATWESRDAGRDKGIGMLAQRVAALEKEGATTVQRLITPQLVELVGRDIHILGILDRLNDRIGALEKGASSE